MSRSFLYCNLRCFLVTDYRRHFACENAPASECSHMLESIALQVTDEPRIVHLNFLEPPD